MNPARLQLRRLFHLVAAEGVGRAGMLLATILTARFLGPAAYGVFTLGFASGSIVGVVTEAGLGGYLTREGALLPRGLAHEVRTITRFRGVLALLGVMVAAALAVGGARPADNVAVIVVLSLAFALRAVSQTPLSVLVGMGETGPTVKQQTIERVTLLVLLGILLPLAATPLVAGAAFLSAHLVGAAAAFAAWRARAPHSADAGSTPALGTLLRTTWPFLVGAICVALYIHGGAVMVAAQSGDHEAGAYGAAVGVYLAVVGLPTLLMRSVIREMAAAPAGEVTQRALVQSLFAATVIPGLMAVLAHPAALLLFGPEFADVGALLRLLAAGAAASFLVAWLLYVLYVSHHERSYAAATVAGLAAFLAVAGVLVPRNGALGAVAGLVTAEVTGLAVVGVLAARAGLLPSGRALRRRVVASIGLGLLPVAGAVATTAVLARMASPAGVLTAAGLVAGAAAIPGLRRVWPPDQRSISTSATVVMNDSGNPSRT